MPGREDILIDWFLEISRYLGWQPTSNIIPLGTNLSVRQGVAELIRTTFGGNEGAIWHCLIFVKENFQDIIDELMPDTPLSPIIYSQKLPGIAEMLADRLSDDIDKNYWQKFSVIADGYPFKTIPLSSLTVLWNRNRDASRYYGLARYTDNNKWMQTRFVYRDEAEDWKGNPRQSTVVNFEEMDDQDSRLFIIGLVVDLMRMGKMLIDDYIFVGNILDLSEYTARK